MSRCLRPRPASGSGPSRLHGRRAAPTGSALARHRRMHLSARVGLGAPKHTALAAIRDLEPVPRGPYCGAVGWVDADRRRAELAVGIRTFWAQRDDAGRRMLHFGTGAGSPGGRTPGRVEGDRAEGGPARRPHRPTVRGGPMTGGSGLGRRAARRPSGRLDQRGRPRPHCRRRRLRDPQGGRRGPFARRRHAARLQRSLAGMGLPAADFAVVDAGIEAVLRSPWSSGGCATPSPVARPAGFGPAHRSSHVCRHRRPVAAPWPSCTLVTVPWTRNERSATAGVKTTSYAENVIALAYAKERGADEAVFANTAGDLCEGTGSNVRRPRRGAVDTARAGGAAPRGDPRAGPGVGPGWGRTAGVEVREVCVPLADLAAADEVFITSSTRDVLPATSVDGRSPSGRAGVHRAAELFARRSAELVDP